MFFCRIDQFEQNVFIGIREMTHEFNHPINEFDLMLFSEISPR